MSTFFEAHFKAKDWMTVSLNVKECTRVAVFEKLLHGLVQSQLHLDFPPITSELKLLQIIYNLSIKSQ